METSICELRKKDVINLIDGKKLGRVFDVVFTYPEGKVLGVVVPGTSKFSFLKRRFFIDLKKVVCVGEDAILVEVRLPHEPPNKSCPAPRPNRPHFEGNFDGVE